MVWSRNQGESIEDVIVAAVYDFGVAPASSRARRLFGENINNALPGVTADAWDAARCVPFPVGEANPAEWMRRQVASAADLYPVGLRPVHTFPGGTFSQVLRNPVVPETEDFRLDLAKVIFRVAIL